MPECPTGATPKGCANGPPACACSPPNRTPPQRSRPSAPTTTPGPPTSSALSTRSPPTTRQPSANGSSPAQHAISTRSTTAEASPLQLPDVPSSARGTALISVLGCISVDRPFAAQFATVGHENHAVHRQRSAVLAVADTGDGQDRGIRPIRSMGPTQPPAVCEVWRAPKDASPAGPPGSFRRISTVR